MEKADRRRILWWLVVVALALCVYETTTREAGIVNAYLRLHWPGWYDFLSFPGEKNQVAAALLVLVGVVVTLYTIPVLVIYVALRSGIRHGWGYDIGPFEDLVPSIYWLHFALAIVLAWLFWRAVFPRFLKLIGLWSPFRRSRKARPWSLRLWHFFGDWGEQGKFGNRPTGSWSGLGEVLCWPYQEGDIFLGRPKWPWPFPGGLLRPVGIPTEKHMVTIASPGSGKSTAGLIPNLCIHPGSALVIDPKGELATITASRRAFGLGQDVKVLDPFGTVSGKGWERQGWTTGAGYNVFDEMAAGAKDKPDLPISYANVLTDALVAHVNEREPFFDNTAKTFMAGLLLYVFTLPAAERNLVTFRRFLLAGDVEGYRALVAAGTIKAEQRLTPFDVLLEKMEQGPDGPYREAIHAAASSFGAMEDRVRSNVLATAQTHTAFLDIPEIRATVTGRSTFLLSDLRKQAVTVYLCLPPNEMVGASGRWLRMFVLLFIDMMYRPGPKPKRPILLAIDEFPSLGPLPAIEAGAAMLRSYGVRLWVVGQDIPQFQKAYPKGWMTFIGSAQAVQFMGITQPETVQYIVDLLGKHTGVTFDPRQPGVPREHVRDLLDQDQVSKLLRPARKNQIVWRGDRRPMLLKICPYFSYLPFWYFGRDPRYRQKFRHAFWRGLKVVLTGWVPSGRRRRPVPPATA